MSVRRALWMVALGVGGIAWGISALGESPWDRLFTVNRVEADPKKAYNLTEQNGPWMIMVCSFSGDHARQQAKTLVLELRKRYKLPAYVYEKKFDLSKGLSGRGVDEFGNPKHMRYQNGGPEIDEVAVLVGDYPAVDDPEAQETLHKIKYYTPDCLAPKQGQTTARSLAGFRALQSAVQAILLPADSPQRNQGPMNHAFVTTNPMLPADYYVPKGLDPLVIKANEGVKHSLLDCPGKYTVQVAHFTGRVVSKPQEVAAIEEGKEKFDSQLAKAAYMAHKLTEALRLKGYQAYEFHDRYASIVTVGSFDSLGRPGPNNVTELDPRITRIINQFKSEGTSQMIGGKPMITAKTLVGIPFDPQPILVYVPKRSVSAALSRDPVSPR